MSGSVDISVVIVNFNGGDTILRTLEALHGQSVAPAAVVVVDNASTDGSAQQILQKFPAVQLVINDANEGFAAANNRAIRECCSSQWVALLNPDAFPRQDWLARLIEGVSRYPDYRAFACLQIDANNAAVIDGAGDEYHRSGLAWRRWHGHPVGRLAAEDDDVFSACAAAALYHRSTFLDCGGFDESYFCYFEDVDLGFRLQLGGHRTRFLAAAIVDHVGSATTGRNSDFSVYHGHRNLEWTYFKNMPGIRLWMYLPEHLLMVLVSLAYYGSKGQGKVLLKAKWDALLGLGRALRRRGENRWGDSPGEPVSGAFTGGFLTPYTGRRGR